MTTTVQHPAFHLRRHRFTVSEYHEMDVTGLLTADTPTELLDGEIFDMSPINSLHAAAVKRLNRILSRLLGDKVLLSVQDPILLSDNSEPQPDIAVLLFRDDFYADGHPKPEDILLVVEVADSTVYKDRNLKMPLYARAGIPEAWLVDLGKQTVEVSRKPGSDGYTDIQEYGEDEQIQSGLVKRLAVRAILG